MLQKYAMGWLPAVIWSRYMAKKAKRRGRPPGSKNKSTGLGKGGKAAASMDLAELRRYIDGLESTLAERVTEQRSFLQGKLSELSGYISSKATGAYRAVVPAPTKTGKRAKAQPKYQSKKDRSIKWSGRGMTPTWMKEEMKGTKLKKDDFLIR
jgi:DNA-binding protein H-NS